MSVEQVKQRRLFRWGVGTGTLLLGGLLCADVDDATSGAKVTHDATTGATQLDWAALPDAYYFVEQSANLTDGFDSVKLYKDLDADGNLSTGVVTNSELLFFRFYHTDDKGDARLRSDDDGDKIINILEADAGMDAYQTEVFTDVDNDNLADYWEEFFFNSILSVSDPNEKIFSDGLTLQEAYNAGTNPQEFDSDGDGYLDVWEIANGFDPQYDESRDNLLYGLEQDFDGDGISNRNELLNNTDLEDPADAPAPPPNFVVIDLGRINELDGIDLANNGWLLLQKQISPYNSVRWHWTETEELSVNYDAVYAYAINSSGIVVGEWEDYQNYPSGSGPPAHAVYWSAESDEHTVLPPLSSGFQYQQALDISEDNRIVGLGLHPDNSDYQTSMTGTIGTGLTTLPSYFSVGEWPYEEQGTRYANIKRINSSGSYIGDRIVYSSGVKVSTDPVLVVDGIVTVLSDDAVDINEIDQVIGNKESNGLIGKNGFLVSNSQSEVTFDLVYPDKLLGIASPATSDIPLSFVSHYLLFIQKTELNMSGNEVPVSIVDQNSFYKYDISELVDTTRYSKLGKTIFGYITPKSLTSPDGNMIYYEAYDQTDGNEIHGMLLLKVDVAVDADRSGTQFDPGIEFAGADQTSESEPYRFWLNNDRDSGSDDEALDNEPISGQEDFWHDIISSRDLEDYSRLWIDVGGIAEQLKDGSLRLGLEWKNVTDNPRIKLYKSVEVDGGMKYLFDENVADLQKEVANRSAIQFNTGNFGGPPDEFYVNKNEPVYFETSFWDDLPGDGIEHFLFEGAGEGKGELVFVLQSASGGAYEDIDMSMTGVWFDLKDIKEMYQHFTVGDSVNADPTSSPSEINGVSKSDLDEMEMDENYILFVHGWRMYPWERRAFGETAFKRLYWQGYKGRFGMFSWPTEWAPRVWWFFENPDPLDPQNYTRSERKARLSGEGLESLLNTLNGQYSSSRLHMFAHSMGNIVASEALRLHGTGKLLSTFITCQSASTAHSYDGVNPEVLETDSSSQTPEVYRNYPVGNQPYYGQIDDAVGTIINFHNLEDNALEGWLFGQKLKPDNGWYYDDNDSRWYRDDSVWPVPDTALFFPSDRHEIFAHIAEARSRALGSAVHGQFTVAGSVDGSFDMNSGFSSQEFNFTDTKEDHSAQFRSTNMRRFEFYRTLIDFMGL